MSWKEFRPQNKVPELADHPLWTNHLNITSELKQKSYLYSNTSSAIKKEGKELNGGQGANHSTFKGQMCVFFLNQDLELKIII